MKAAHVRLAALSDIDPDVIYRLNWIKRCRWQDGRLEVQAVFADEGSSDPSDHLYRWIKASDFPFLIIGSRWYRGAMVGKPLVRKRLVLKSTATKPRGVTTSGEDPKKLSLAPAYKLVSDTGNTVVLELSGHDEGSIDKEPSRIYLPLSEVYRSHYFSIPSALPSVLGGLINGAFSNESLQAWDPEGTGWINEVTREARITPTPRLTHDLTKRLARTVFSSDGARALRIIHNWIQSAFASPEPMPHKHIREWLPIVPLPYNSATWDASVVRLPADPEGRKQLLVLHIESFDAPEPYLELEIVSTQSSSNFGDGLSLHGGGGKILEPDPHAEIDDIDLGWNPSLEPIEIDDVIARDERAARRVPRVASPYSHASGGRLKGVESIEVGQGSTQAFGNPGRSVAPLIFTDGDEMSDPRPSLMDSIRAIRQATEFVVSAHRKQHIIAHYRFLPCESKVYEFRVPASESRRAMNAAIPRQFVVAEVRVGARYAYVFEPERRNESQPLPLGVIWLSEREGNSGHRLLSSDDLYTIIQQIESSIRDGHSWIRSVENQGHAHARAVIHAAGNPPEIASLKRFSNRIATQLMTVVGDVRAI